MVESLRAAIAAAGIRPSGIRFDSQHRAGAFGSRIGSPGRGDGDLQFHRRTATRPPSRRPPPAGEERGRLGPRLLFAGAGGSLYRLNPSSLGGIGASTALLTGTSPPVALPEAHREAARRTRRRLPGRYFPQSNCECLIKPAQARLARFADSGVSLRRSCCSRLLGCAIHRSTMRNLIPCKN